MIGIDTVLIVAVVCVLLEGFFSGSEIAIVSANRVRIRERASKGDRGARMVESYLAKPQVLLATTLLGTNLATVTLSVTVALFLITANVQPSEVLAILIVTPATLILGEVIPKTMYQQYADSIVTRIVYPLRVASIVFRPAVWLMSGFAGALTRLVGSKQQPFITREELSILLETETNPRADTRDAISESEREMIANVLEMTEAEASDVMVPLSEVTALPADATIAEATREIADKMHSRLPVFEGRVDNVVGILHVFDLLRDTLTTSREISTIARPVQFVPESKPAVDLLVELQAAGNHIAVVVDEYGGAVGIVTVEDLLEEIVGEIEDEHDAQPSTIIQERPGVWRVEARTSIERLNDELKLSLPEHDDYETLAGLLLDEFKRIPKAGESAVIGGITLRVVKASDRAVEEVQLLRRRKR